MSVKQITCEFCGKEVSYYNITCHQATRKCIEVSRPQRIRKLKKQLEAIELQKQKLEKKKNKKEVMLKQLEGEQESAELKESNIEIDGKIYTWEYLQSAVSYMRTEFKSQGGIPHWWKQKQVAIFQKFGDSPLF